MEKQRKKSASEKNELQEKMVIPYIKPVRVGNFKLWRGKYVIGSGKDKNTIDCLHVSNLDGSWQVRIPSTMLIYGVIMNGYATMDDKIKENLLGMLTTNMYNICTNASVALHDAMFFLTEMLSFPYLLLSEKEMKRRMEKSFKFSGMDKDKWKAHVKSLLDYRCQLYELIERKKERIIEDYEQQLDERRDYGKAQEENDMKHDEIAEEAINVLSEEEKADE